MFLISTVYEYDVYLQMTTILWTENPVAPSDAAAPDTSLSCILTITEHSLYTISAVLGRKWYLGVVYIFETQSDIKIHIQTLFKTHQWNEVEILRQRFYLS